MAAQLLKLSPGVAFEQTEDKTLANQLAWPLWQWWLVVCSVGWLFWQPQRPYTEKGQIEGPECPTQNMGRNPKSFEGVTGLLLGRYAQGLIIKVTDMQKQLNFHPHQISYTFYWLQKVGPWFIDWDIWADTEVAATSPQDPVPHPTLSPRPIMSVISCIAQMENDRAWYRRREPIHQGVAGTPARSVYRREF